MKQAILFCLFACCAFSVFSQCVPDELYRDSSIGVYPPPMSDSNPDGGITESACINSAYEFTLTLKIPETVTISGVEVALDSVVIEQEGAVGGLPIGFSYDCNPGDCVYTPADTLGCLRILGTATTENAPDIYPLTISTTIYTSSLGSINMEFPNTVIAGADGEYNLTLEEEGSANCFIVSTEDYLTSKVRITNTPNPFSLTTTIEIASDIQEELNFVVFDMLGKVIHRRKVWIQPGINNFDFDGSMLPNGIYNFSLSSELGAVSRKMVINH